MHSTVQAIQAATQALGDDCAPWVIRGALISDGFSPDKADTIIRWAKQFLRKIKS